MALLTNHMRIVGDHLAEVAAKSGDATHFDLFGRSAFNRYYYSAFLSVRTALRTIDSRWATPSHQAVPAVLKGDVLARLKRQTPVISLKSLFTEDKIRALKVGDEVLISGVVFTGRDAAGLASHPQ
jgi:hypothetical protein